MSSQFENDESNPETDLSDKTPQWYVLKCQVNREDRVKRELEWRVLQANLDKYVEEVYVPIERVKAFDKNGKQREIKRKIYPGYILVKMALNNETWFLMRETPGVGEFAGASGRPMPMPPEEVERLLKYHDEQTEEKPRIDVPFAVGDRATVKDGSFAGNKGEVSNVDVVGGKVTVNIVIFGKPTPVEFEYWQVEKADDEG